MIKSNSISVDEFEDSYHYTVPTLGKLLKSFHFFDQANFSENGLLSQISNQHLYQIMMTFCNLMEVELKPKAGAVTSASTFLKDPCMQKMAASDADAIVNRMGLF